ncbi:MAG: membrane protein insertase YidC [Candidatus Omnitrophota bacterium]|nr:membrane protein insertase YidC [Candidatus Omnitrophota bacterium]
MEKRLLLAIGLSLLVLLSWSALAPKPQVIVQSAQNQSGIVQSESGKPQEKTIIASVPIPESDQPLLQINRPDAELFFDEQHAALNKVVFLGDRQHSFPLQLGFLTDDGSLKYAKIKSTTSAISFAAQDGSKKVTKTFTLYKVNNTIELQVNFQNLTNSPIVINIPLLLGKVDLSHKNAQLRYEDLYLVTAEKSQHLSVTKEFSINNAKVLGLRDQYFCLIVEPQADSYRAFLKKINNSEAEIGLTSENITLQPGGQIGHLFSIYLGPQDLKVITQIRPIWSGIIYFGTFDFISQILLQTLEFLYRIFHNWGWAIVFLSLLVYFILYPLSLKQMRSMKEMQAIQPKVEELRRLYKDNPQKMNKEIMELYKLHKVNPFGGCLPLLLQMPIFFALYNALMRSTALRGAKFLWIRDLSEPDRLFTLPVSLPVLGNELNILPIIMALGMFFQQKLTSAQATGPSAEQQKLMLIVMPIMFGFIFYHMPAGLVLYWLINSILMLVFQLRLSKAK